MHLRELAKKLYSETAPGVGDPTRFLQEERQVRASVSSFLGTKCSISKKWNELDLDYIRLSSVLCKFTSLHLDFKKQGTITVFADDDPNKPSSLRYTIGFSSKYDLVSKFKVVDGSVSCSFGGISPADEDMKPFVDRLEPLASSGRILIRPRPIIILNSPQPALEGQSRTFDMFNVDPDSPFESWTLTDQVGQSSIPVQDEKQIDNSELTEASFLMPFIAGVPLSDLAKILDDEEHNFAEMRSAVVLL